MKINPKKAALIGLAASTLFSATGCSTSEPVNVYGPPNVMGSEGPEATMDPGNNSPDKVYGPPESIETMDPADNEPETVYGPPEMFEDEPTISPADNDPVEVYGPPEMFE